MVAAAATELEGEHDFAASNPRELQIELEAPFERVVFADVGGCGGGDGDGDADFAGNRAVAAHVWSHFEPSHLPRPGSLVSKFRFYHSRNGRMKEGFFQLMHNSVVRNVIRAAVTRECDAA